MLVRVLDLPVGTRVFVDTGSGSGAPERFYGTVIGTDPEGLNNVSVRWDTGERHAWYFDREGMPIWEKGFVWLFDSLEAFDALTPVMPFRGI